MLFIFMVVNELFVNVIVFMLVLFNFFILLKNVLVFKCLGVLSFMMIVGLFLILEVRFCLRICVCF